MRDDLRTVYVMLVVVFVLIVVNVGLLYYKKEIKKQNDTPTTQATISQSPTQSSTSREFVSSASTDRWLTYVNTQYGYSIQYPPEFMVNKRENVPGYIDTVALMHKNGNMLNTVVTIFVTEKKPGDELVSQKGFDGNGNTVVAYPFLVKNNLVSIVGTIYSAQQGTDRYESIIKQITTSFKSL